MIAAGNTDVGRVRTENQDCYDYRICSENLAWAVVCDGMGGANGGNIASSMAVTAIREQLEKSVLQKLSPNSIKLILFSALAAANSLVFDRGAKNQELAGMGTTAVAVMVLDNTAYIAYAGDSRLYHIRDGRAKLVTKDHSVVQVLVDDGKITEEEAKTHPKKRYITKALGVQASVDPDYREETLEPGESLLLCTDGLTNYVDNEEIGPVVKERSEQGAVNHLIALANERGGSDNITAVILTV